MDHHGDNMDHHGDVRSSYDFTLPGQQRKGVVQSSTSITRTTTTQWERQRVWLWTSLRACLSGEGSDIVDQGLAAELHIVTEQHHQPVVTLDLSLIQ